MNLENIFTDKSIKGKDKTLMICNWLLEDHLPVNVLLAFAENKKSTMKATCIEAIEQASKKDSKIVNESTFLFVIKSLSEKEPRVKWESARVIGNTAHLFESKLEMAIDNLLLNAKHEGTVVRWSAAYALGEIIKLKTKYNIQLIEHVTQIIEAEEKNSIRKIYQAAIKKVMK
jgi:HEAT repeat protein